MELRITKLSIVFLLFLTGCYYDVEEELYPMIDCQTTEMTYSNDVLPIIETNCFLCHRSTANFGNITLEGYDQLIDLVDDGSLLGAIKHGSGYSPMPKNKAQLLQCEIEKIQAWIDEGALNN